MLTALWIATAAAQDTWPADATIEDALRLQMPPQGLSAAADIAADIPFPPVSIPVVQGGDIPLGGFPGCLVDYGYRMTNGVVAAEVLTASIVPTNGVLTLQADVRVEVNTQSDPMVLDLGAACISGDCDAWIDPFVVDVTAPITLGATNGQLHATIGAIQWNHNLVGDDVNITNCTAGDIVNAIQGLFDIYGWVIDQAEPYIDDQIQAVVADLQPAIDDALAVAQFSDQIDLLGTTLYVDFAPEDANVTPAGVDIQVGGSVYADQHACIAAYDVGGSRRSSGPVPAVNTLPATTHVGARVAADILDQGMYAIWRGGLLCQNLEGGEIGGFTLDTNLLNLIGGESYGELFPETKPLTVRTVPMRPPESVPSATYDVAVAVQDLGIDFYAELEGRQARALAFTVSPEVGLDVAFNNTTGALAVELALPTDYNAVLRGDPMVPDAVEVIENVEGLVGTLASTALTGALGDSLSFDLPAFEAAPGVRYGVRNLQVTDTTGGWITAEATVGTVTYGQGQGCEEGCSGSTGCSTPGAPLSWGGGLLALVLLRRRRG